MDPWQYLPNPWRQAMQELPETVSADLEEIRFRVDRPVHLYGPGWNRPMVHPDVPDPLTAADLDRIVGVLVDYSVYARVEELRQGFITLPGGHRVGIAGRAVVKNGRIEMLRQVSGLNMRVGRQIIGPAQSLVEKLRALGVGGSWLLVSPPRAGKTTLLRDTVRFLGNEGRRVVVVDERSEIAGFGGAGVFGCDLGYHTDVLDGWPKSRGIETALRTLGPDVIAVDELGGADDLTAVVRARYSGVDVVATVHARSKDDLFQRPEMLPILRNGAFDAVVVLAANPRPGTVVDVWTWAGAP